MQNFIEGLHPSTIVLSHGFAIMLNNTVEAVEVRNLYGQQIVGGEFSCNCGKFKGKLSNDAATEGVSYETTHSE